MINHLLVVLSNIFKQDEGTIQIHLYCNLDLLFTVVFFEIHSEPAKSIQERNIPISCQDSSPLDIGNPNRFWLSCLSPLVFFQKDYEIIRLSNLRYSLTFILTLSVSDDGYSRNTSYALRLNI